MLEIGSISEMTPAALFKGFFILLAFTAAVSYIIHHFTHSKFVLPGDYYQVRGGRRIYIPFGSTIIFTIGLFVILTSKLLGVIISVAFVLVAYKAIFRK